MTPGETRDSARQDGLMAGAVRLLVREASRGPLVAITLGLQAWERSRGLREAVLRHGDEVLQIAAHTPLGRFLPQPQIDDDAESEGLRIAADARETTIKVATPPEPKPRRPARQGAARPAGAAQTSRATTVDSAPATSAQQTAEAREAGAPGTMTVEVEKVTEQLSIAEPTSREELPIPDFDNVSLASLRARLRSLSLEQLVTLREWEQAHAHRLPVVTLLDNRIAKLAADRTAGGSPSYANGSQHASAEEATERGREAGRQAEQAAEDEGGTLRV